MGRIKREGEEAFAGKRTSCLKGDFSSRDSAACRLFLNQIETARYESYLCHADQIIVHKEGMSGKVQHATSWREGHSGRSQGSEVLEWSTVEEDGESKRKCTMRGLSKQDAFL